MDQTNNNNVQKGERISFSLIKYVIIVLIVVLTSIAFCIFLNFDTYIYFLYRIALVATNGMRNMLGTLILDFIIVGMIMHEKNRQKQIIISISILFVLLVIRYSTKNYLYTKQPTSIGIELNDYTGSINTDNILEKFNADFAMVKLGTYSFEREDSFIAEAWLSDNEASLQSINDSVGYYIVLEDLDSELSLRFANDFCNIVENYSYSGKYPLMIAFRSKLYENDITLHDANSFLFNVNEYIEEKGYQFACFMEYGLYYQYYGMNDLSFDYVPCCMINQDGASPKNIHTMLIENTLVDSNGWVENPKVCLIEYYPERYSFIKIQNLFRNINLFFSSINTYSIN